MVENHPCLVASNGFDWASISSPRNAVKKRKLRPNKLVQLLSCLLELNSPPHFYVSLPLDMVNEANKPFSLMIMTHLTWTY